MSDQTTETHAVIQNGEIISGGERCYKCGAPTMMRELADPFGKSDRMRWVCRNCTQWPAMARIP